MRIKTSITLSEDVVSRVDGLVTKGESRSGVIERLIREVLDQRARRARELEDLETINAHAEQLNEEAEDVLTYQVEP